MLGSLWKKWHLAHDIQAYGNTVISRIQDEYVRQLRAADWISDAAKERAVQKRECPTPTDRPAARDPS
jgi:predicted metalloendopeptidase